MTSPSKGKIEFNIDKNLSQEILSKINSSMSYLRKNNIDVTLQKSNLKDGISVILKVLDVGDISDKEMKEVFKILFFDTEYNGNPFKLIDKDKEFQLPDDREECLDWFIIEK